VMHILIISFYCDICTILDFTVKLLVDPFASLLILKYTSFRLHGECSRRHTEEPAPCLHSKEGGASCDCSSGSAVRINFFKIWKFSSLDQWILQRFDRFCWWYLVKMGVACYAVDDLTEGYSCVQLYNIY
jgi:hypothetical protein